MSNLVLELLARFSAGLPDRLPSEPMELLGAWLDEAERARATPNPTAVTLSTASGDGDPSARIVLCRGLDRARGTATVFTNYESRKARDLGENPRAEVVFFWDGASRQARLHGPVTRVADEEAEAYFASRPLLSRLGAWASRQSQPVESRTALAERLLEVMRRFDVSMADLALARPAARVPKPPHWGGFRLWADRVELWTMGAGRLHDRAEWKRRLDPSPDGYVGGVWASTRLSP